MCNVNQVSNATLKTRKKSFSKVLATFRNQIIMCSQEMTFIKFVCSKVFEQRGTSDGISVLMDPDFDMIGKITFITADFNFLSYNKSC